MNLRQSAKMKKEYVWEIGDYTDSVFADSYEEARKILLDELFIQEVEQ